MAVLIMNNNKNKKEINLLDLINERNNYLNTEADGMEVNEISELHMHKILFILFGQFGAKFKKNLFKCDFEAWRYGPVEINCRNFFKNKISEYKDVFNVQITDKELTYITKLIDILVKTSPWVLVDLTHSMSAWYENYNENDEIHNKKIPNSEIIKSLKETDIYYDGQ